jgi:hypothetical protein
MDRTESFDRLDFDDNLASHDEIESMVTQQLSTIDHWYMFLGFKDDASRMKLDTNGPRTCALEQARPENTVHRDATADRSMDDGLNLVR